MLQLIAVLSCSEYFHMTKVIRASNVKTMPNIEPKPWPQISRPGSGSWY